MTNLKLTKEQIEALRALSAELADKLESGEAVTLERAVEKWEPKHDAIIAARSSRITNACLDLQAYRDEFAPGYVVPPVGESVWTPYQDTHGEWSALYHMAYRSPTSIYMPEDICRALCDKLNSGEVVL